MASKTSSVGEIPSNSVDATKEAIDKTSEAGGLQPEHNNNVSSEIKKINKPLTWETKSVKYFDTSGESQNVNKLGNDSFLHFKPNTNSDTQKIIKFKSPKP